MTARLVGYANRKLNEIVIPGSHDGGIYMYAKDNVQTQALNIFEQAMAGIRFFDIRIAVQAIRMNDGTTVNVSKAFHLDQKLIGGKKNTTQSMGKFGGWGGSLQQILMDAQRYVTQYPSEFLILKFSKSFGWPNIFTLCKNILGNDQYKPNWGFRNLNTATVGSLAGKVITLFPPAILAEFEQKGVLDIRNVADTDWGFLPFKELYNAETKKCDSYDMAGNGLQYFGKFSSTSKVDDNTRKQRKLMESGGGSADPAVVGMMYWTTTGLFANIRNRNDTMWTNGSQSALINTWTSGLEGSIRNQLGHKQNLLEVLNMNHGNMLKAFMPNIVMMDFSNRQRCNTIYGLNGVTPQDLDRMIDRQRPDIVDKLRKEQETASRLR